jgi:uncharacterized protein YndB with AHSA1/START domain
VSNTKTASKFVISRTFNAPLDRVWKAWTEPEQMAEWWGPKGFKAEVKKFDLKPDGIFHYRLVSPQGQEIWGKFLFREIVAEKRLVFLSGFSDENEGMTHHPMAPVWPLHMLSTISFSEADGKTTVTVEWRPYEASEAEVKAFDDGRESMTGGWTGTLDKLEGHLANT